MCGSNRLNVMTNLENGKGKKNMAKRNKKKVVEDRWDKKEEKGV